MDSLGSKFFPVKYLPRFLNKLNTSFILKAAFPISWVSSCGLMNENDPISLGFSPMIPSLPYITLLDQSVYP